MDREARLTKAEVADRNDAGHLPRWIQFARERFALPAVLLVGVAQATSAQYLVRPQLEVVGVILAALGIGSLFTLLRLMDEVKDLEKDRVAHPLRPLPRGLLDPVDVRRAIHWGAGGLFGVGILVATVGNPVAGALLGASVGYALLMYREFFAPRFLEDHPFTNAVAHEVVLLPLYGFATAVVAPQLALSEPVLWFGLTGMGASFAYEVCRKLDPNAHAVLRTYLNVHGRHRTVAAVTFGVGFLALTATRIDVHHVIWPFAALLLLTLPLLYVRPGRFRLVEATATLLVLIQVLAPTLRHVWRAFS